MKRLTKEQVLMLHKELIAISGGSPELRDEGLLDSALNTPFQTFGEAELYPTIIEKAARLGYSLIKNHAFVDGNKRIGTHAMLVFLALNHIEVEYEDNELINMILKIAAGQIDDQQLLVWLQDHIV
ncbi:MAG: type II toxin-antitoxin system death-on-curing family toxin [Ruminococcus sp.]|nr:type II toxin-antitoxin system death-on-curing family toxin [Ruminococcus sp.]